MTRERLRREMSAREFEQWLAFDMISPIGDERVDILLSLLRQTLIAVNCGKGKSPPTLKELLPFGGKSRAPSLDDLIAPMLPPPETP